MAENLRKQVESKDLKIINDEAAKRALVEEKEQAEAAKGRPRGLWRLKLGRWMI